MNLDDSKQNFFCPFCINQNVVASAKSNNTTSGETNRSESNVKRKEKNKYVEIVYGENYIKKIIIKPKYDKS